jgi:AmmeMemoRadiSam system protein B
MMGPVRPPAVAGSFYPGSPGELRRLVDALFTAAARLPGTPVGGVGRPLAPIGILVPHAGLVYSGVPAAAAWACLRSGLGGSNNKGGSPDTAGSPGTADRPVVVLLGTNHRAGWLDGVGAWESGAWAVPSGEFEVDAILAAEIVALGPPFLVDRDAHNGEHSLEVQLPLLAAAVPDARIVPLAVSAGTGRPALEAGTRLGRLLAARRAAGDRIVLAISSDMAHYPPADACERATEALLPAILDLDPVMLAALEADMRLARIRGLACGMCGIEPVVLGLAALRAMGATVGAVLAATTSADAGGARDRTVGYLATRFDAPPVS